MQLLTFLLVTVIFWFAGGATLKIFYAMTQPKGALDVMFGWQKMLDRWYDKANKGSKLHHWLHDSLGGCPMCTSFWFAPVWFLVYMIFTKVVFYWFIDDFVTSTAAKIFVDFIWYWVFWSTEAILGLLIIKWRK